MDRRQYLEATCGTVLVGTLAGCSSDSSASSGTNVTEHLEAAGTELEAANNALSTESEKFSETDFEEGGVDVQTTAVTEHLDAAGSELDTAESAATESQQETIEAARSWIALARSLTTFIDVFADGYNGVSNGLSYFQSQRYEDAAETLDTASDTLSDAEEELVIVQDRIENLDTEALNNLDEVEISTFEADIERLSGFIDAMIPMVDGLRQESLGMVDFQTGSTEIENEEYTAAKARFKDARSHFSSAETTFKDLEESAPESLQGSVIELTCYGSALRESADHFVATAAALENGNREKANEEAEKGQEALDQCNFN
ncbi:hypothetical protein [Halomicrobium salinisoli]|uniref:hypothetical protein n=1 Tax=Halomicrobium salinisoli TaxID=2878391 RepID=UPI001CF02971|nr:hypothetical protein [Halomicrobium salinisoli]